MSVNEELSEHSHEARDPFDKRVAVTMAIIAALLAIVSVAGHRASNEELLAQQKASDHKQEAASRSVDVGRETEGVQITLAAGAGQYQTKIASVGRSREIPRRGGAGALPEKGRKDQLL
jgi:hypothetical protein